MFVGTFRGMEARGQAAPAATEAKQVAMPVLSPGAQRVKLLGKQRLVISASLGLNAPERLPVIGHQ